MRAPGLTWFRLPLFVWAHYATSHHHDPGHPGGRHHDPAGGARAAASSFGIFDPALRRRPGPLPAPVLVLLAPGGLHHDPARDGGDQRAHRLLLPQADLRLQLRRLLQPGHRRHRLPRLGPPHVREQPVGLRRPGLLVPELPGGHPLRHQDLQLDRDPVQGLDLLRHPDALRPRLHRPVHRRRADRPVPGHAGHRRAPPRHLLRGRPLPLRHGGRHGHGLPRRPPLLVAQDDRADVLRSAGPDLARCSSSSAST